MLNWFHGEAESSDNFAASLGYRLDFSETAQSTFCLRADPVFQQLDINQAVLADPALLDISSDEADALIEDLNRHFSEDGIRFEALAADRWYCSLPRSLQVRTMSPGAATGRSVSLTMVQGEDAGVWRSWLSEIEMLLYAHRVNQRRAEAGQSVINSLWLWGEGNIDTLPPSIRSSDNAAVYSSDFYTRSVADYSGVEHRSLDTIINNELADEVLIVDTGLASALATGDSNGYDKVLAQLESDVFNVLNRYSRVHKNLTLNIWCGENRWISPGSPPSVTGSIGRWLSAAFGFGKNIERGGR